MAAAALIACWCIFFTQYANAFMLTAFFPESPLGQKIGASMIGLVFAAYPLTTCLSIPIPPWCVDRFGIRATVAIGLLLAAAGSLLCGLVPVALPATASAAAISAVLLCCRALSGLGAALAEAGCFTALSSGDYGRRLGLVMSSCEVVIGLGASIGIALGGALYELGKDSVFGQSWHCLLYTSPSPRDVEESRMPSSA